MEIFKWRYVINKMEHRNSDIEIKIIDEEDLVQVRTLAQEIFPFTYREIVAPDQIDYMMDLIYTLEALKAQRKDGQVFLMIFFSGKPAGFAAYSRLNDAGDFKLNKIYLDTRLQGQGLGRALLFDIITRVKSEGGLRLQLNVNKYNKAIGFYQKTGFTKIKDELLDIGNGYFMDDYVMGLNLVGDFIT